MSLKLSDIFSFSHSAEFGSYQKWLEMSERFATDPYLRMSEQDIEALKDWSFVQELWEKVIPEARVVFSSYSESLKAELANYEKVVSAWETTNKLFVFYKAVLEKLTKLYLDSLSSMLTEVYQEVYGTPDKKVVLLMEEFRNKKVIRLNIINHIGGHDYKEDFSLEGGAAHIILGTIVAIYFILTTGGERIIIFDEALAAFHDTTLSRFMRILRHFVDSLDFTFMIIAHDYIRMADFIDKVYVVGDGEYKEIPSSGVSSFLRTPGGVGVK